MKKWVAQELVSLQRLLVFLGTTHIQQQGDSREIPSLDGRAPTKEKVGFVWIREGKAEKNKLQTKVCSSFWSFPWIEGEIQTFCTLKTRNISLLPSALPTLFSLESKIIGKRKNQGFLHWFPWLSIPSVFSLRSTELCKYFFGLQWQKIIGFSKWMQEKKVVIIQPKYGTQLA